MHGVPMSVRGGIHHICAPELVNAIHRPLPDWRWCPWGRAPQAGSRLQWGEGYTVPVYAARAGGTCASDLIHRHYLTSELVSSMSCCSGRHTAAALGEGEQECELFVRSAPDYVLQISVCAGAY